MAVTKKTVASKTKATAAPSATSAAPAHAEQHRRTMVGMVVSNKMMKTCVVKVERQVRDEMYGKYTFKSNKFKIHDENNTAQVGDMVRVVESRPMSRDKRWALQSVIRRAKGNVLSKVEV